MSKQPAASSGIDHIQQFEALFNYATIGMVVTNKQGEIIHFNRHAGQQFGYTAEEVAGQTIEILIPQRHHAAHVQLRAHYYQHPGPRRMGEGRDLFGRKKDGTTFPVEVSLSSYVIQGELFVIGFIIDITVRKNNEAVVLQQRDELERVTREVRQLNQELEQKVESRTQMLRETLTVLEQSKEDLSRALENEKSLNELKSRFVTTASHEFRTPLSTILSSVFLLEQYNQGENADRRAKHLRYIKDSVADMKSILEDFLSLGKLEEGLIKPRCELVAAADFIADVQKLIEEMERLCRYGQQLRLTVDGAASVYIDRQLFRNILQNLLSNAIKFSPEESTIDIVCVLKQEGMQLSVKDSGIGIDEEDQVHLFERFFRARNAVNIQGTGLGLHIVNQYLQLMNGRIELKSQLGEGSTFTISIPSEK